MGQILHGSARTTEAVRRAIQEGLKVLAARYGINEKTVTKWRNGTLSMMRRWALRNRHRRF